MTFRLWRCFIFRKRSSPIPSIQKHEHICLISCMNDQFRTVISVCEYFNNHSYFICFARLSLSWKRFLSHAINVFLFTVNCKMRTLPARSRGKISVRKGKIVSQRHYVEGWRLDKLLLFPIQSREGLEEEV